MGAAHGPRPRPGDVRVHDPGHRRRDPARRHAGARAAAARGSSTALAGIVARRRRRAAHGRDVERILVAGGRRHAVSGSPAASGRAATRAIVATSRRRSSTGGCSAPARCPRRVTQAAAALPLRPRRDADPLRARRAARLEGADAERLGAGPIVHVTPGLDGVSRAVNEAERGLLPAEATIVCGQPCALDPSRAPGRQVDPLDPAAGAAGGARQGRRRGRARRRRRQLDGGAPRGVRRPDRRPGSGESIPNLGAATLRRVVLSPADIESLNCNLVGGDIYAGSCALDQNLLWRPLAAGARATRRRSTGSVPHRREHASRARVSAAAPGYLVAQGSAPGRRSPGGFLRGCRALVSETRALRDLDRERLLRGGRRRLRRGRVRRDRDLGVQAAGRRRREPSRSCATRAGRHQLRADGAVGPPARHPGHGGAAGPGGADRGDVRVHAPPCRVRARVRPLPDRAAGRRVPSRMRDDRRRRPPPGRRRRARSGRDARLRAGPSPRSGTTVCSSTRSPTRSRCSTRPGSATWGSCPTRTTCGTTQPSGTSSAAPLRIAGVHVADWPGEDGRSDRVLPGTGVSRTKRSRRRRSASRAGTGTSMWRSSPSPTASGRSPSRRPRAAHTPPPRLCSRSPATASETPSRRAPVDLVVIHHKVLLTRQPARGVPLRPAGPASTDPARGTPTAPRVR